MKGELSNLSMPQLVAKYNELKPASAKAIKKFSSKKAAIARIQKLNGAERRGRKSTFETVTVVKEKLEGATHKGSMREVIVEALKKRGGEMKMEAIMVLTHHGRALGVKARGACKALAAAGVVKLS